MKGMRLTAQAQADRDDFELDTEDRGCTCFISPPCIFCEHHGNPRNQAEDESCWEPDVVDEPPVMPDVVRPATGPFIGVDIAANGRDCAVVVIASRLIDARIHIVNARDLLDAASVLIKAFEDMRTRRAAVANASIPPENRP